MDEIDPNFFEKAMDHQLLLYYWHLRHKGHDVQDKIEELEAKLYTSIKDGNAPEILWQRDIDELQLLLAVADWESNNDRVFATKAIVYKLGYTKVVINLENNHWRPHFHIKYKSERKASYAIDNFERLAGNLDKKYEKPILEWASHKQKSLILTWENLKAGKDVRELVLHADEV